MKRRNALIVFVLIVTIVLIADRVTKIVAVEQLTGHPPIAFLPLLLDFALVYNTGGAFGLFAGGGYLFVFVAIAAFAVIVIYLWRASDLLPAIVIALSLIGGGALGNAYDRAFAGAVPDFIHTIFIEFPVFNIADIALTLGEILLLVAVTILWFKPRPQAGAGQQLEPLAGSEVLGASGLASAGEPLAAGEPLDGQAGELEE